MYKKCMTLRLQNCLIYSMAQLVYHIQMLDCAVTGHRVSNIRMSYSGLFVELEWGRVNTESYTGGFWSVIEHVTQVGAAVSTLHLHPLSTWNHKHHGLILHPLSTWNHEHHGLTLHPLSTWNHEHHGLTLHPLSTWNHKHHGLTLHPLST